MSRKPAKTVPESRPAQVERKPDGTFAKGVSGCPGGRPATADEIMDLARIDSEEAYRKVAAIMRNDEHRQQLAAALAILKAAGVFRNADAPQPPAQPGANPYTGKSTDELLRCASVSSTLPQ